MGRITIARPGKEYRWLPLVFLIAAIMLPPIARATPIAGGPLTGNAVWRLSGSPYEVSGSVEVGEGRTLLIEAGVVVTFAGSTSGISVMDGGTLSVQGLAGAPVILTSVSDAAVGGAGSVQAGAWAGISLQGGAEAHLNHAEIRYADVGILIMDATGNVTISDCRFSINNYGLSLFGSMSATQGNVTIVRNTVAENDVGIYYGDGPHAIIGGSLDHRNNILRNTSSGITNDSMDISINATFNWWGDYNGPTADSNPAGRGDVVSGNVDFSGFARISSLAGDLNNDNAVGLEDAIFSLQVMTGMVPGGFHPEFVLAGLDVNQDGKTGLAEAVYTLRSVAGLTE